MGKPHWTVKERDYFILNILPRSRCATGETDMQNGEEWEDLARVMTQAMDARGTRPRGRTYNGDLLYQYWRRVIQPLQKDRKVSTTRPPPQPPAPLAPPTVQTNRSASASSRASSSSTINSAPAPSSRSSNQEGSASSQEQIRSPSSTNSLSVNKDSNTPHPQQISSPYNNMTDENPPPTPRQEQGSSHSSHSSKPRQSCLPAIRTPSS